MNLNTKKASSISMFSVLGLALMTWAAPATLALDPGIVISSKDGALIYGGHGYHLRHPAIGPHQIYATEASGTELRQPGAEDTLLWNGAHPISKFDLSSDDHLLAFVSHELQEDVEPDAANYVVRTSDRRGHTATRHYWEDSLLRVIDRRGTELETLSRVRAFAWQPGSRKLAYITGDYFEGGLGFSSTGTWVLVAGSGQAPVQVHDGGYDLAWGPQGRLLIMDLGATGPTTLAYDPAEGGLVAVAFRGIHFSPGHSYFYRPGYEGLSFALYRAEGNQEITDSVGLFGSRRYRSAYPEGWLDDKTLILRSAEATQEDLLLDLADETVLRVGGRVLGLGSSRETLVALVDDQVQVLSRTALPREVPLGVAR